MVNSGCPVHATSFPFSHHDPSLNETNLWTTYEGLREHGPVFHSDQHGGFWVVHQFDEVRQALRDTESLSSARGHRIPEMAAEPSIPVDFDAPKHPKYRALITEVLTPQVVREMEPEIDAMMRGVLQNFVADGGGDIIRKIALPIPLKVLQRIAGFAPETVDQFRVMTDAIWVDIATANAQRPREEFNKLLLHEVEDRRKAPREDFVSSLLQAEIDGQALTEGEILNTLTTLAVGGHETSMNSISSLFYLLARDPDLQARLRSGEINTRSFVEELLRYGTPIQVTARVTLRPVTIGGQLIPENNWVLLLLGAANRDAEHFEDPQSFNPDAQARAHLAFGWGVHQCAGAALARAELRLLIEAIKDMPPFELDGPVKFSHLQGGTHFGPTVLPVSIRTAASV